MGIHRFTSVVRNNIQNRNNETDVLIENAKAAMALIQKPQWSSVLAPKNSLPSLIAPGLYLENQFHCAFNGIYDQPATLANIQANRTWEGLNQDVKFRRFDGVGHSEFVESFAATDLGDLTIRLTNLLYNIHINGLSGLFAGTNINFFIGANGATYADKAALQTAFEAVSTLWSTLPTEVQDYYTLIGFAQPLWDVLQPNLWLLLTNTFCGGNSDLIIFQPLYVS